MLLHSMHKAAGCLADSSVASPVERHTSESCTAKSNLNLLLHCAAYEHGFDSITSSGFLAEVTGVALLAASPGSVLTGHCPALQISTGLDSSNTFQIVRCIRDFVHLRQATVLMALLQPAPETYELFDDVLLLSEGEVAVQCCVVVLLLVEGGHVFGCVFLCGGCMGTAKPLSGLGLCAPASDVGTSEHGGPVHCLCWNGPKSE